MPKPSNSFLDKMLGTFFLTAYTGIGLLAGIGVLEKVTGDKEENTDK